MMWLAGWVAGCLLSFCWGYGLRGILERNRRD